MHSIIPTNNKIIILQVQEKIINKQSRSVHIMYVHNNSQFPQYDFREQTGIVHLVLHNKVKEYTN